MATDTKQTSQLLLREQDTYVAWGATGAGKSRMLQIAAGVKHRESFPCGASATPVTQSGSAVTALTLEPRAGLHEHTVTLIDTEGPGAADTDSKREDAVQSNNARVLRQGECQSFLFVVRPTAGGGLSAMDEAAYRSLVRCFGAQPHSILGVVNCDPSADMTADEQKAYRADLLSELTRRGMRTHNWHFVPEIATAKEEEVAQSALWVEMRGLRAEQHRVIAERETVERLAREQQQLQERLTAEAKQRELQLVDQKRHAAAELERARVAALELERLRAEDEAKLAEEKKQRDADAAREQLAAAARRAAELQEQRRQNEVRRGARVRIKCEENNGNPCTRTTQQWTVGHVEDHGRPYWNCKWEGHRHHDPWMRGY